MSRLRIAIFLYAAAVTFPHQFVQNLLSRFTDAYGRPPLYTAALTLVIAAGVFLTALFVRAVSYQPRRNLLAALWLLNFLVMFAIHSLLMANDTELVHFPQYFPEGAALLILTLSPVESMAWLLWFGWLDEGFQYVFLSAGRATLLDFNDMLMDLAGGAAGILFVIAFLRLESRAPEPWPAFLGRLARRPGIRVVALVLAVAAILLATGKLVVYESPAAPPHWFALSRLHNDSFWLFQPWVLGPRHFHEMMPPEGTVVLLLAVALFVPLERRFRILPERAPRVVS